MYVCNGENLKKKKQEADGLGGGNQWLAGLFLDQLLLHLNLFKLRSPARSERLSMTQPGSQLLAHEIQGKTLDDLVARSTSQLSAAEEGEAGGDGGLRWDSFCVRFVVF